MKTEKVYTMPKSIKKYISQHAHTHAHPNTHTHMHRCSESENSDYTEFLWNMYEQQEV